MTGFATRPVGPGRPLRVVVVGTGLMGRLWLRTVTGSGAAELVGAADLDLESARTALAEVGRSDLPVHTDGVRLAADTGADAVIDVTVPVAHHPVTTAALFAGLPVLGEKPAADTLAAALSLAAAAEVTGQLFMVSQSRRWNPQLAALRDLTRDLGRIGTVSTQFYKEARFPGFRAQMAHVLLLDMAIHPFDSLRYLLDDEPVAVTCQEYNPAWSWFAGDAAATAVFEMAGGARFCYEGSWCSVGADTSWNSNWRVSGEHGSALWDGDSEPVAEFADDAPARGGYARSPYSDIAGSLAIFTESLASGTVPMGEIHENAMSLAMVEAAVTASVSGQRVLIDDVLARAWEQAVAAESREDVRAVLASWTSVREALAAPARAARAG